LPAYPALVFVHVCITIHKHVGLRLHVCAVTWWSNGKGRDQSSPGGWRRVRGPYLLLLARANRIYLCLTIEMHLHRALIVSDHVRFQSRSERSVEKHRGWPERAIGRGRWGGGQGGGWYLGDGLDSTRDIVKGLLGEDLLLDVEGIALLDREREVELKHGIVLQNGEAWRMS